MLVTGGIAGRVTEECRERIVGVSPQVNLMDISDLVREEQRGDAPAKSKLDVLLAEAEIFFGWLPDNFMVRTPRLKWAQLMSAGADRWLNTGIMESSVILTNVSGIHATPISEFVLGLMLMCVKQAPLCFQLKQAKEWRRVTPSVLRGKTVGVVGLGSIGREVARLTKAFGMRVLATRRSAKGTERARYVDIMFPPGQLAHLLAESDFVVIAVPLTHETRKLIGEKELRAMKPTAYLINIARGGIIDEAALIHALEENWIAGAGLDVFATEPLPVTSRLWELPNVILSPHISGGHEDYMIRATDVFVENLRRYLNGQKLRNVVDKKKGY